MKKQSSYCVLALKGKPHEIRAMLQKLVDIRTGGAHNGKTNS